MDTTIWLSTDEVAERLDVTGSRVAQFVANGQLKATRMGQRRWGYREADVEAFQAERRLNPPVGIPMYRGCAGRGTALIADHDLDDYENMIEQNVWLDDHGGGRRGLAEESDERWA